MPGNSFSHRDSISCGGGSGSSQQQQHGRVVQRQKEARKMPVTTAQEEPFVRQLPGSTCAAVLRGHCLSNKPCRGGGSRGVSHVHQLP